MGHTADTLTAALRKAAPTVGGMSMMLASERGASRTLLLRYAKRLREAAQILEDLAG